MVGREHGANHSFSNRSLHRPGGAEPQVALRNSGGSAGRGGCRHRHPLVLRGAGGIAQAPSRHHAHVFGRAIYGGCGGGRGLAVESLAGTAALSHRKCTQPKSKRAHGSAADTMEMALSDRDDRRAEPPAARLDQQLRAAALLPLQSTLVRGKLRLYRRTGSVGAVFPGPVHALGLRARRQRDRRPPEGISGPRLGDLCACRHGRALVLALGGTGAGARHP